MDESDDSDKNAESDKNEKWEKPNWKFDKNEGWNRIPYSYNEPKIKRVIKLGNQVESQFGSKGSKLTE